MRLVLASTSRYRRALLARLGLDFECVPPGCDEETLKPSLAHLPLSQRAVSLARSKAESVAARHPDAIILGSDQIAALDDEVLDKPGTAPRAVAQLARLSGRTHTLYTAVALHEPATGRTEEAVDAATLTMRALPRSSLERYVARDAPLDCCGSYRIESLGVALFERVSCEDPTAIEGLPLTLVVALLRRFDVDLLG